MPGDSLLINNKAETKNTYDAIVVGSGISGRWAAKELTEKGLRVLMLERGRPLDHITGYKTATLNPWEFPHRGRATVKQKEDYPVIARPWGMYGIKVSSGCQNPSLSYMAFTARAADYAVSELKKQNL